MSRTLRLGRYISWTVLDQFISMGVPRLILFPILAKIMGVDTFGSFVLALGAILMVGLAPSNGLIGYIIRCLARQNEQGQALLIRTTMVLSLVTMIPIALVYVIGSNLIASAFGDDPVVARLLPVLALFLVLTNVVETSLAAYRVRREFARMTLIHSVQSALLFLAVPLYYAMGVAGVATAHFLAAAIALVVIAWLERDVLLKRPFFSPRSARDAMKVWPALSAAAVITLSAGYLDRAFLGHWWPPSDPETATVVTSYFAAASMAALVAIPGTLLANMVLSLLGSVQHADHLDRRFYTLYILGVFALAIVVFGVGWLIGGTLVRTFYPDVAENAVQLWNHVMLGFSIFNVGTLCRPFASKFLSPAVLPMVSIVNFVARVTPLVLLIPTRGAMGAAQGLIIGSSVSSLLWMSLYVKHFILARKIPDLSDDDTISTDVSSSNGGA